MNPNRPTHPHIKGDKILPDVQGYTAFPLLRAKRMPAKDPVTMIAPPQSVFLMAVQTDDCLGGASRHQANPKSTGTHSGRLIQKTLHTVLSLKPMEKKRTETYNGHVVFCTIAAPQRPPDTKPRAEKRVTIPVYLGLSARGAMSVKINWTSAVIPPEPMPCILKKSEDIRPQFAYHEHKGEERMQTTHCPRSDKPLYVTGRGAQNACKAKETQRS